MISSMYVLTWLILSNYFLPNFAIDYFNSSIEALNNKQSQAEIDAQIQTMNVWMEYYKTHCLKRANIPRNFASWDSSYFIFSSYS